MLNGLKLSSMESNRARDYERSKKPTQKKLFLSNLFPLFIFFLRQLHSLSDMFR